MLFIFLNSKSPCTYNQKPTLTKQMAASNSAVEEKKTENEIEEKELWLIKWSRSDDVLLRKLTNHCSTIREKAYENFKGSSWSYWNATMIIPNFLFLGDRSSAGDVEQLIKRDVKYILNCAGPKCTSEIEYDSNIFKIHILNAQDNNKCQIINDYINESIEFIERAKADKEKILVHCVGGVNRSATIVAAYLLYIKYRKNIFEIASLLIQKRTSVLRNRQFLKQLLQYQIYLENERRPKKHVKSD